MKTQKILEKAKIQLILNEPFFASAALRMEYVEDNSIETACTDGIKIIYNTDFFTKLSLEERKCLIAHEILHVISLHHLRVQERDPETWNEACDYVVNPLLVDSGFKLPQGGLFESRFRNKSAEEIYPLLMKEKKDKKNGGGSGSSGSGNENPNGFGGVQAPPETEDVMQMEQEAKQMALEAYNAGKLAGKVPNGMKEMVESLIEPKHDWKDILNRFVSEVVKNDYSWSKPNPRYLPSGMYLPILESLEVGKIVFAIDTSGSIDSRLLQEFVSEIQDAMTNFNVPVFVIHCDTEIHKIEELTESDPITPVGRGGTSFQPVFDHVNENMEDCKAIIYFTDGDAFDDYQEPNCPVLWAIYNNSRFNPDFGEVIFVERNK